MPNVHSKKQTTRKFINKYEDNIKLKIFSDSHGREITKILCYKHSIQATGIVKQGAPIQEIVKNIETENHPNIVVIAGANNVYKNDLCSATRNLKEILNSTEDKSVFVARIPHRHDLLERSRVNMEIRKANRLHSKICKAYQNAHFISMESMQRDCYTKHGMHLNNRGKKFLDQNI